MTQIGESVAVGVPEPEEEVETCFACEWRCSVDQQGDHEALWHTRELDYVDRDVGTVERRDGYSRAWRNAGRVPWTDNPGVNPRRWPDAYHIGRHRAATEYSYPEYATEGHHLISCDIFRESEYPALVHNAILMGYDINCSENGWHFPAHIVDIVCHNLQHHASQHSWSEPAPLKFDLDELVAPLLAHLEQHVFHMCRHDPDGELESQAGILDLLHRMSEVIRRKLVRWEWYLTKLARMHLGDIRSYGIDIGHVAHEGETFIIVYDRSKSVTMLESNLSLAGFPNFEHYVAAAVEDLDAGMNPGVPFSWWLSRRLYRERLGRALGPNSPIARGQVV